MILQASSSPTRAAAGVDAPTKAEWWFVYIVLVATAAIPGLELRYTFIDQTFNEGFWGLAYLIGFRYLWSVKTQALQLARRSPVLWVLIALLFASTLWSVNSKETITDSIELLGTTLIGLYIATRFTLTQFLRIVAIMFGTIGLLCVVLVFVNPGYGRADWGSGPWQGIYQDKNLLGAAASLALISQVVLFQSLRGRGRWLLAASILLSGLLLVASNSATALGDCSVVVVALLAAWGWRSPKFGGLARVATVIFAVVAVAAIFVFGLNSDSVFELLGRQSNLTGRTDFWPYLQQAIADRPLLGFGYDAFFQSSTGADYLSEYVVQAGGWTPFHAHNSFLQTLLDVGYVGLATLVTLLSISLARAMGYFTRERSSASIWPLAIILLLTTASFTETRYLDYNTLEWIVFIAAVFYPLRREPNEPAK